MSSRGLRHELATGGPAKAAGAALPHNGHGERDDAHASARPVNIAFPFIGEKLGGSHISVLNLIKHLDQHRYRASVLLDIGDGPVGGLFRDEDVPFEVMSPLSVTDFGSAGNLLRYGAAHVSRLARYLRQSRTPIVQSNDGRMHVFGSIASRLAGVRHLWHHRSDPGASSLRWVSPIGADHLVTVSHFAGPKPGWWSAANKWTIVPSPFPTDMIVPDRNACRRTLIETLGCADDALIVGFFANLVPRKRPFDFVRAIAAFKEAYPSRPIAAPIFGKETRIATTEVENLADELGVADCIHLMGFRYPAEDWLAGCDILFVPSVREPFGRTLIEAMIVGTVVVAVDSGGNPEAIEDGRTGYLIPIEDPIAAASRFRDIAADREAAGTLATRARKDALERFGMRRHAEAIMAIYDRLLEKRDRSVATAGRCLATASTIASTCKR